MSLPQHIDDRPPALDPGRVYIVYIFGRDNLGAGNVTDHIKQDDLVFLSAGDTTPATRARHLDHHRCRQVVHKSASALGMDLDASLGQVRVKTGGYPFCIRLIPAGDLVLQHLKDRLPFGCRNTAGLIIHDALL